MTLRIRVTKNDFARISRELRPRLRDAINETALDVETLAKQRAPVKTGNLRRSLHTAPAAEELRATVGTNVEYARFVEYGTSRMGPRPYLTPALESNRPRFVDRLARAFER